MSRILNLRKRQFLAIKQEDITGVCLKYVAKYSMDMLTLPEFLEINERALTEVLKLDSLSVREADLLDTCVRWAKYRAENRRNVASVDYKTVLAPLLPLIGFPLMPITYFSANVAAKKMS
jgi:hypothetical protein